MQHNMLNQLQVDQVYNREDLCEDLNSFSCLADPHTLSWLKWHAVLNRMQIPMKLLWWRRQGCSSACTFPLSCCSTSKWLVISGSIIGTLWFCFYPAPKPSHLETSAWSGAHNGFWLCQDWGAHCPSVDTLLGNLLQLLLHDRHHLVSHCRTFINRQTDEDVNCEHGSISFTSHLTANNQHMILVLIFRGDW